MRQLTLLTLSFLLLFLVTGCDDEPSGGPNRGDDTTVDGTDADDGDVQADVVPDAPDDTGDDVGGDADQGGPDVPVDTGGDGNLFPSCTPNPDGELCGNGLDDDCDGLVDELCSCAPQGETQACYLGAASDLEVEDGRCRAGEQECRLEFWSECEGAVGPIDEICDNDIDDDCDGSVDENCIFDPPVAICPEDFEGPVLSTYTLQGEYSDPLGVRIVQAFWSQVSWPPGHSHDITFSPDGTEISFFADVAGGYLFEFYVENEEGRSATCQTLFTATTADVLRVEMFWNPDYVEGEGLPTDRSDVDLHVAIDPPDGDLTWHYYRDESVGIHLGTVNQDNCHWVNCNTCPDYAEETPDEDLPTECAQIPLSTDKYRRRECVCRWLISNPPAGTTPDDIWPLPDLEWGNAGSDTDDPRLDLDDTEGKGPENINIRRPEPGTYRIAVHFFDPDGFGTPDLNGRRHIEAHVRVICGGNVVYDSGTSEPDGVELGGVSQISGGYWENDVWEVGEIDISYGAGDTVSCNFTEFGSVGDRQICPLCLSDGGCAGDEGKACGDAGSVCENSNDCNGTLTCADAGDAIDHCVL